MRFRQLRNLLLYVHKRFGQADQAVAFELATRGSQ
jgi:hypothetical protein